MTKLQEKAIELTDELNFDLFNEYEGNQPMLGVTIASGYCLIGLALPDGNEINLYNSEEDNRNPDMLKSTLNFNLKQFKKLIKSIKL